MNAVRANFHTHSVFSDGKNTMEDMVLEALALGMHTLGFSDHVDPAPRVCIRDLAGYLAEGRRLREKYAGRIELLIGAEVDNLMPASAAEGVDYIVGSTHYLDLGMETPLAVDYDPETLTRVCREHFGGDFCRLAEAYYEFEASIADRLHPTFIGHFDLVTCHAERGQLFDTSGRRYRTAALGAMEHLVSRGIPFEINTGGVSRGYRTELYPDMFLLKSLREMGGEILINSDAHRKELLMGSFDQAVQAAAACGFDHVNILTRDSTGRIGFRQEGL